MMTSAALTRQRRQMHRRIRAALTARRISSTVPVPGQADEPPPEPRS